MTEPDWKEPEKAIWFQPGTTEYRRNLRRIGDVPTAPPPKPGPQVSWVREASNAPLVVAVLVVSVLAICALHWIVTGRPVWINWIGGGP